jgi:hypothetical protein
MSVPYRGSAINVMGLKVSGRMDNSFVTILINVHFDCHDRVSAVNGRGKDRGGC